MAGDTLKKLVAECIKAGARSTGMMTLRDADVVEGVEWMEIDDLTANVRVKTCTPTGTYHANIRYFTVRVSEALG